MIFILTRFKFLIWCIKVAKKTNSSIPLTSITAILPTAVPTAPAIEVSMHCNAHQWSILSWISFDWLSELTDQNSAESNNICQQNSCQKKATERRTLQVLWLEFKVKKPADLATYLLSMTIHVWNTSIWVCGPCIHITPAVNDKAYKAYYLRLQVKEGISNRKSVFQEKCFVTSN